MSFARARTPIAMIAAAAIVLLSAIVGLNVPSAVATNDPADDVTTTCDQGGDWIKYEFEGGEFVKEHGDVDLTVEVTGYKVEDGIEDKGEPIQVTVTAPGNSVITEYCVKAGSETTPVVLDRSGETVTINAPEGSDGKVHAISHIKLHAAPYAAPTCEGFTYDFGESETGMHVNIEVTNLDTGETEHFNWHDDGGELEGEMTLNPRERADWPAEWDGANVSITWIQVHGYNFHWTGSASLDCDETPTSTPSEKPSPSPSPSPEVTPESDPTPTPSGEPTPTPSPSETPAGSLEGSIAVGECLNDAPFIAYDVQIDPADTPLDDRTVLLVLTDGTNTEEIELGELGADGTLSGRTLWPGASVADDGVTPTGWPGWEQLDDGTWVETDGNYAWTRGDIDAALVVNPDIQVDLAYPEATPECATGPEQADETTTEAGAGSDDELPQTGSSVTWIALGALALIAVGATAVVLVKRRRA